MWCPTCRGEFVDEVKVCPDCDVPLVTQMPEGEDSDEPFVKVFRTADTSLLPVVKSVLGGAGISYIVQGDEAQSLYPLGSMGGGSDERLLGAVVLVPESRREAAQAVLEELEGIGPETDDDDSDDSESPEERE